ncbi:hypothetical protein F5Y07DRAFT_380515 [Xylaria sp. FL0933]|nr:hypothetical protein F5Y07DRAFT_380515 [Xylaria sp. FL0933]
MADPIRDAGLFIAHNRLAAPLEDPEHPGQNEERYSESPPSYRTDPSGAPTRSQSPDAPYEEQDPGWREYQLYTEHRATLPYYQFEAQVTEECRNLYKASNPTRSSPKSWEIGQEIKALAVEFIKQRWVEQGIWKDEWNAGNRPDGLWKHEVPLKSDSESETDSGSEAGPSNIFAPGWISPAERRRRKGKEKATQDPKQIEERRAVLEREREASRPYYQFLWQVSQERGHTQGAKEVDEHTADDLLAVSTRAYESVKWKWIEWGIWHDRWGILPGMWWKHERPVQELLANDPILSRAREVESAGQDERGSPARRPRFNLFGGFQRHGHEERRSPARRPPGGLFDGAAVGESQQHDNQERESSDSRPPGGVLDGYVSRHNQALLIPGHQRHGQWRLREDGSPVWSPVEASTQYGEQMREDSPDGSVLDHSSIARGPENSPVHGSPPGESPAPDLVMNDPAEPSSPIPVAPRRSKRLQEARLNAGREVIEVVIDDPPKPKATKRKGARTNNRKAASSAKPQGVSKAEGPTKRKRRARKG